MSDRLKYDVPLQGGLDGIVSDALRGIDQKVPIKGIVTHRDPDGKLVSVVTTKRGTRILATHNEKLERTNDDAKIVKRPRRLQRKRF